MATAVRLLLIVLSSYGGHPWCQTSHLTENRQSLFHHILLPILMNQMIPLTVLIKKTQMNLHLSWLGSYLLPSPQSRRGLAFSSIFFKVLTWCKTFCLGDKTLQTTNATYFLKRIPVKQCALSPSARAYLFYADFNGFVISSGRSFLDYWQLLG